MAVKHRRSVFHAFLDSGSNEVDTAGICSIALIGTFVGLSVYSVMKGDHHFDMMGFGTGAAALIGALAANGFFRNRQQNGNDNHGDNPPPEPPA